jgi:hypothetical protein
VIKMKEKKKDNANNKKENIKIVREIMIVKII